LSLGVAPTIVNQVVTVGWRIGRQVSLLVLRVTGEGYIVVGNDARETVLEKLMDKWDRIFEEARWGAIERAMELYSQLFEWLDQLGRKVSKYRGGADVVLPPRDLDADELRSLLGRYRR
jgi:hypothetical protein